MKENNHKRLGDVIKKLMKNPKLAGRLDDLDAIEIWQILLVPLYVIILLIKEYLNGFYMLNSILQ